MSLPGVNILIFDSKKIKEKDIISRPPSRCRPLTSKKVFREVHNQSTFISRPGSSFGLRPLTPGSSMAQTLKKSFQKSNAILSELPKNIKIERIPEDEIGCLIQCERTIKNSHPMMTAVIEITDKGFLALGPGQAFTFSSNAEE